MPWVRVVRRGEELGVTHVSAVCAGTLACSNAVRKGGLCEQCARKMREGGGSRPGLRKSPMPSLCLCVAGTTSGTRACDRWGLRRDSFAVQACGLLGFWALAIAMPPPWWIAHWMPFAVTTAL